MVNISVLVSGGGTNLQSIIDACKDGGKLYQKARVSLVLSSRGDAYALTRAEADDILTAVIDTKHFPDADERASQILGLLDEAETDLVVLAGYMQVVHKDIIEAYRGRIINIHPSLIPKHCGKGYYGVHVHESVLAAGDSESGATVHYVDEGVDTGDIIIQKKAPVLEGDTPQMLQQRVLGIEHEILIDAILKVIADKSLY
ncbi:MAG: phosphoribosylglycinamide formyltransferase [Clostridiales Family XIII bacterium]|jgi:phosphoribosylglycinamide formyltransferase-1|nr:phosphoribosylglycinamide formyltransferase [Clostridiales Family XIII bacterium]